MKTQHSQNKYIKKKMETIIVQPPLLYKGYPEKHRGEEYTPKKDNEWVQIKCSAFIIIILFLVILHA